MLATAEREPDVWATVGIHPHEADQHPHVDTAKLVERAAHPRVVGIGESGLDYYYDHSDRARQQAGLLVEQAVDHLTSFGPEAMGHTPPKKLKPVASQSPSTAGKVGQLGT